MRTNMKKYLKYPYYSPLEEIVDVICVRTGNYDKSFYRNLVNFYFCQVASNMRCSISSLDRGVIPINFYGVSLATSGYSKGHSSNIVVEEVMSSFRKQFLDVVFKTISTYWIEKIAKRISNTKSTEYDDELIKVEKEFKTLGAFLFSFDSGSLPAISNYVKSFLWVV